MNVLLTRILYSVTPGPAMIRAVYEYSSLILVTLVNLSSYVFLWRRRNWIVTKRLPFLGMNILKISFQFSTYTAKKTPFRSEIMRYITTSSKQTRPFYVRIEIKTLVNLRMLFAYMSPESGQMDALESVYWFLLFWTVYCEFYSMFSTVLIPSFGLLCMALLVLKT